MEIYRITNGKTSTTDFIRDILDTADLDERLDLNVLTMRIIASCGNRYVRYNTTDTFRTFAIAYLESERDSISRKIDAIAADFDPVNEYDYTKEVTEDKNEIRHYERDSGSEESTAANYTDTHSVSADNETGLQLRTQDGHAENIEENKTVTDGNITDDETRNNDNKITTTESGYKTSPIDRVRKALELYNYNIYDDIIISLSDKMFIGIF